MDFITSLPISTNWNDKTYNFILVILDQLTKIVYYELVKVMIDTSDLAKVIINIVVGHHNLSNSMVNNCDSVFIPKF